MKEWRKVGREGEGAYYLVSRKGEESLPTREQQGMDSPISVPEFNPKPLGKLLLVRLA